MHIIIDGWCLCRRAIEVTVYQAYKNDLALANMKILANPLLINEVASAFAERYHDIGREYERFMDNMAIPLLGIQIPLDMDDSAPVEIEDKYSLHVKGDIKIVHRHSDEVFAILRL